MNNLGDNELFEVMASIYAKTGCGEVAECQERHWGVDGSKERLVVKALLGDDDF